MTRSEPAAPTAVEARFVANPADPQANFELGAQSEREGDLERAEQYYVRVTVAAPGTPIGRRAGHRLASVLVRAHRLDEAEARCRALLDDDPADRPARFLLAAILDGLDRSPEATVELEALEHEKPDDPHVYLELGRHYREMGDEARAEQMLRRYVELDPHGREAGAVRFDLDERALERNIASRQAAPTPPAPVPATPTAAPQERAP